MAEKMVDCVVLRDYWDADDNRVTAGTVISLEIEQAMDGVESGALSRYKSAEVDDPEKPAAAKRGRPPIARNP